MVNVKDSTKKNSNAPISSPHPPYYQMITEAITTMKDRTGSSQPSIAKFMDENYAKQLPPNFKRTLSIQLKRLVRSEKLVKVKNSYKVPASVDKVKKTVIAVKKQPPKKETAKVAEKYSAKKVVEKAKRTKRLSQLRTPEALKKTKKVTPSKRKAGKMTGLSPPAKKAKK